MLLYLWSGKLLLPRCMRSSVRASANIAEDKILFFDVLVSTEFSCRKLNIFYIKSSYANTCAMGTSIRVQCVMLPFKTDSTSINWKTTTLWIARLHMTVIRIDEKNSFVQNRVNVVTELFQCKTIHPYDIFCTNFRVIYIFVSWTYLWSVSSENIECLWIFYN